MIELSGRSQAPRRTAAGGRNRGVVALAVLAAVVLGGCAARQGPTAGELPGALGPAADGLSRLYVYRPKGPVLGAVVPEVVVNGRVLGTLRPGEVLFRNARPGRYELRLSTRPEAVVALRLSAGRQRYVEVAPEWAGLGWELAAHPQPEEQALQVIPELTVVAPAENDGGA